MTIMEERRKTVRLDMIIESSLALINNFICTQQLNRAKTTLSMVKELLPYHESYEFFDQNKPCDLFGIDWGGQDLTGKSIEVICDHGLGDTIQMLRYIREIKNSGAKVVINSLSGDSIKRLMERFEFVDVFSNHHVKCDYHTNIMQLPYLYHNCYLWNEIIETGNIPDQPVIDKIESSLWFQKDQFGLKFNSNPNNDLFVGKSIPSSLFDHLNYVSLEPDADWSKNFETGDILDLVCFMSSLPFVVSVDTLTLHLAGSMNIPTYGLLCNSADPRWGLNSDTVWYPSVTLLRQDEHGSWDNAVSQITA